MPTTPNTDFYDAVISAFSLVSFADGDVHPSERSRLVQFIKDEPLFKGINAEKIQDDVSDLIKGLSRNFETGKINLLNKITLVKDNAIYRDMVLKLARLTLISDDKILEAEETLLADIHRALGVQEE